MHQRRSREVVESSLVQPAAPPFPGTGDGVIQRDKQRREDEKARQFNTSCHGTGDDRRARRREHRLEEEVGVRRVAGAVGRTGERSIVEFLSSVAQKIEAGELEVPAVTFTEGWIHQVEADDSVGQKSNADDHGVLEENVDRVLGPGQTTLQGGESEVHDEHQHAGDHDPQIVDSELIGLPDWDQVHRINCCRFFLGGWFFRIRRHIWIRHRVFPDGCRIGFVCWFRISRCRGIVRDLVLSHRWRNYQSGNG